jgi:hypothetical protein
MACAELESGHSYNDLRKPYIEPTLLELYVSWNSGTSRTFHFTRASQGVELVLRSTTSPRVFKRLFYELTAWDCSSIWKPTCVPCCAVERLYLAGESIFIHKQPTLAQAVITCSYQ